MMLPITFYPCPIVFLEYMHSDIAEYRKDLMKYVWGILKSDDGNIKYYGYLTVSRFVQVFETPAKVTLQGAFLVLTVYCENCLLNST